MHLLQPRLSVLREIWRKPIARQRVDLNQQSGERMAQSCAQFHLKQLINHVPPVQHIHLRPGLRVQAREMRDGRADHQWGDG